MNDINKEQLKACGWGFDYTDKDVIEIQNKHPNATGTIDGQFYDLQNCVVTMRAQAARTEELEAHCAIMSQTIADLLNRVDEAYAPADGGISMHAMGQSPDWFVEAAFQACYGRPTSCALTRNKGKSDDD